MIFSIILVLEICEFEEIFLILKSTQKVSNDLEKTKMLSEIKSFLYLYIKLIEYIPHSQL